MPVILAQTLDNPELLALLIDHTLLKPEALPRDIIRVCAEAREFGFCSVCVNPCWVSLTAQELAGTKVHVCATVGFPLGANKAGTKIAEAKTALEDGASELDTMQNIGALRAGNFHLVRTEIAEITSLAHARGAIVKVILETCLLNDEEKRVACSLAAEANADFVKTSTGFSTGGARVEDVRLMRNTVGDSMGVKASGGIRTLAALREMVEVGANRIGTSSGVKLIGEARGALAHTDLTAAAAPDRAKFQY